MLSCPNSLTPSPGSGEQETHGRPSQSSGAPVCGSMRVKGLLYHATRARVRSQRNCTAESWPLGAWSEELPGGTQGQGTQEVTNSPRCPPQMPLSDLILSLKGEGTPLQGTELAGGRGAELLTFALRLPHRERFLGLAPLGLTRQVPISWTLLLSAREGKLPPQMLRKAFLLNRFERLFPSPCASGQCAGELKAAAPGGLSTGSIP